MEVPKEDQELSEEEINDKIRDEAYSEIDGEENDQPDNEEQDESEEFSFDDEEDAESEASDEEPEEESEKPDNEDESNKGIEDSKEEPEDEPNYEELAEKYNVSVEDAESIVKQQKHYKNDPNELAKALLNSQRGYSKLETEHKALKEQTSTPRQKEVTTDSVKQFIEEKKYIVNGRCFTKEDIVSEYCRNQPGLTEDLDDDKVFELACREIRDLTNKEAKAKEASFPVEAKARRSELKSNLKYEVPTEYIEELKEYLDNIEDTNIMNPQFDIQGLAILVKGKHYDEDIAKAKEEGRKEGSKNRKIVTPPVGSSGGNQKGSNVIQFSSEQKERMNAMFGSSTMSLADQRVSYILYYPEQFDKRVVEWANKKENGGK